MARPPRSGARPSEQITQGPILRALVALAGPIVLANLFQTVYQLTDTFWVGRLGASAVAAVSLSFPVLFLLISAGGGLAIAGTILVAQHEGRGDTAAVNHIAGQTYLVVVAVSVVLSVVGYAVARPLMGVMGAGPDVLPDAVRYLQISFLGLVFLFGFFVFQSLMRGVGDVRTPVYIVGGTVLLNFALDPLFILGWGPVPPMGVAGAALATVGTQGLAAVVGLGVLLSGRSRLHIHARGLFPPDLPLIRRMVRLGLPASLDQSTRALGIAVMVTLVASFGSEAVAAYGIGTRFLSFVIIPAIGLSMAASTMVGQNVGAGETARAERSAWISAGFAFVAMSVVGAVFWVFARPLVAAFIPGEPAVIESGTRFLRVMALSFGFIGVQQVLNGAFQGAGQTLAAMVLSILALWVLRFPTAWLLSDRLGWGPEGIWWAFPVSNVVAGTAAALWFWRGSWKRGRLLTDDAPATAADREDEVMEGEIANRVRAADIR